MSKPTRGPSRRKVNNNRNSVCGSAQLEDLDWSRWFTDLIAGHFFYLHVAGPDNTWHRLCCRHSDKPRLSMKDGVLYWLIDREGNE